MHAKQSAAKPSRKEFNTLVIGALGVVFGDIGTSPLYAFREAFHGHNATEITTDNVLGVLSLIFWVMFLIVVIKYFVFVMHADNNGEGGILALLALIGTKSNSSRRKTSYLIALGLFGSALLYGDGVITPAISVLSAVEGLEIAAPQLHTFIVPITITILISLFAFQKHGTGKMGMIFGPITLLWFLALAISGIYSISQYPAVLLAVNPLYAVNFILSKGLGILPVIGMVFLVITGTEALYSDMGHFGLKPIRRGWFIIVFPSLILNYLGQGALLINHPEAADNPFFNLFSGWMLYPMIILAALATVIASQALISGSFSLTHQAVRLGYLPRVTIDHTSETMAGQIYIPQVNMFLMIVCVTLVLIFQESSRLADAYGMAVVCTMMITSLLYYQVAVKHFRRKKIYAALLLIFFLSMELPFLSANFMKLFHGAWIPVVIAGFIYLIMTAWNTGRKKLYEDYHSEVTPMTNYLEKIEDSGYAKVPGTAVYMTSEIRGVPLLMNHNLTHNRVLHEQIILLSILTEEIPYVAENDRYFFKKIKDGFYRIIVYYGFMEEPDVPVLIKNLPYEADILKIDMETTSFFLGRETLIIKKRKRRFFLYLRLKLFSFFSRNMVNATRYFKLPPERVVEIGRQVIL